MSVMFKFSWHIPITAFSPYAEVWTVELDFPVDDVLLAGFFDVVAASRLIAVAVVLEDFFDVVAASRLIAVAVVLADFFDVVAASRLIAVAVVLADFFDVVTASRLIAVAVVLACSFDVVVTSSLIEVAVDLACLFDVVVSVAFLSDDLLDVMAASLLLALAPWEWNVAANRREITSSQSTLLNCSLILITTNA